MNKTIKNPPSSMKCSHWFRAALTLDPWPSSPKLPGQSSGFNPNIEATVSESFSQKGCPRTFQLYQLTDTKINYQKKINTCPSFSHISSFFTSPSSLGCFILRIFASKRIARLAARRRRKPCTISPSLGQLYLRPRCPWDLSIFWFVGLWHVFLQVAWPYVCHNSL